MTGYGMGGSIKTASIRDILAAFAVCNEFNRSGLDPDLLRPIELPRVLWSPEI